MNITSRFVLFVENFSILLDNEHHTIP